jgi:hypothetical protein
MPTVADVLRRYGDGYLERFGAAMPAEHKTVLSLFPRFLRSGLISFFGVAPMLDPHSLDCDTWAYDHFGGPS